MLIENEINKFLENITFNHFKNSLEEISNDETKED